MLGFISTFVNTVSTAANQVASGDVGGAFNTVVNAPAQVGQQVVNTATQIVSGGGGGVGGAPASSSSPLDTFKRILGSGGGGDDYLSIGTVVDGPMTAAATMLASLPIPGAQLFNLAPPLSRSINEAIAGSIDKGREALGITGSNPWVAEQVKKFGGTPAGTKPSASAPNMDAPRPRPATSLQQVAAPPSVSPSEWPGLIPWIRSQLSQVFA